MKSFVMNIISALVVALVSGVILYYYQTDKPDLRYNLSQRLPVTFSSDKGVSENIQLLDVKNIGSSEATGIVIKTNRQIAKYEIQKYTKSDDVNLPKYGEPFEIKYSALPPSGNFKIIIKSDGDGLIASDISIIHSKGKASDVFTNTNAWLYLGIFWGVLFFLIISFMINIKETVTVWWESKLEYDTDKVIKSKKPFYISSEKWIKIKREAWKWELVKDTPDYYCDPLKSTSLHILNTEKPEYLDNESWIKLVYKASKIFKAIINLYLNTTYFNSKTIDLLQLSKPINMSNEDWTEIRKLIFTGFEKIEYKELRSRSIEELIKLYYGTSPYDGDDTLKSVYSDVITRLIHENISKLVHYKTKPYTHLMKHKLDMIKDDDRKTILNNAYNIELANFLRDILTSSTVEIAPDLINIFSDKDKEFIRNIVYHLQYNKILLQIRFNNKQVIDIDKKCVSFLDDNDISTLSAIAYQNAILEIYPILTSEIALKFKNISKPEWLKIVDFDKLTLLSDKILQVDNDLKKYQYLNGCMRSIINNVAIDKNKPYYVNDEEFKSISAIEDEILKSRRRNRVLSTKIDSDITKVSKLKSKLLFQLQIINEVFNDPTIVDRIEDYENLFAPKNYLNLNRLAKSFVENKVY